MPESQAQALVEEPDEALAAAVTARVATKVEVVELRAAINAVKERFEQVDERLDDLTADVHQTRADVVAP
jgi:phage shock protein A